WKSRPRAGRPTVSAEIRELIREMSRANCLWGAPRIHGELIKLGIEIAQSTVAKYMIKRPRRPGQKLDDLPAQPRGRDCGGRSLRRAHDRLQVALWPGHPGSRSAEVDSSCGDGASDCGVDRATNCRGVSLGSGT